MNFISGQAFITMMDSLFNEEEWNGIDTSYTSLRIQQLSTYKNDLPPFSRSLWNIRFRFSCIYQR